MEDRKPDSFLFEENKFSEKIKEEEKDEFKPIEKLNRKLSVYFNPKTINITDEEKKKKIGTIITTIIILVIIISAYYFLIYQPSQEELEKVKTDKINELHSLYKGPLATLPDVTKFEDEIESASNKYEVSKINLINPATKAWRNYLNKSILLHQDSFNRTMETFEENSSSILMNVDEAYELVNSSDVEVLSNIDFKTPNTVTVPVLISRLQAGGGLISVGSIVDIYTMSGTSNSTNESISNNDSIQGCTVLAILRCEESGEVESEYSTTHTLVEGNETNPTEDTNGFKTNVLELIKSSIAGGNDESKTLSLLKDYGVKLSNCEREINLGDLDAEYIVLVEVPSEKTNFLINNMDQIIMTMPTNKAPEWMVNEISSTY